MKTQVIKNCGMPQKTVLWEKCIHEMHLLEQKKDWNQYIKKTIERGAILA